MIKDQLSGFNSTKGEILTGKLEDGLVQVYTGDGKGKTTAALGLAVRAAGRDLDIFIGQFMKSGNYGEHIALRRLQDHIRIEQFGDGDFQLKGEPSEKQVKKAKEGLRKIREEMKSRDHDMIIADEMCVAHHFDLLSLESIIELLSDKPEEVELIFTGRKAPDEVIERADLVTEMKEIKHPYQKGIEAREGIER
ncbi:MAG: cob(I)yrinic acid a,c-diamide adenosyltransferase [Candidatus Thermoplasmatota archaeon]|nr:cob(I)yrinic acid a,c-diamide adenosyltransferase [Candidatus Thermoplasmatota archaeon]